VITEAVTGIFSVTVAIEAEVNHMTDSARDMVPSGWMFPRDAVYGPGLGRHGNDTDQ
jgi:hypothetical protein